MKSKPPIILAVDTATELCSVALGVDHRVYSREVLGQRIHTQALLPMIHELISEAGISIQDITAVAVGKGPGSFTGVRIGVGLAQGLAFGLNCSIYAISTLEALAVQGIAHASTPNHVIIPMIDARLKEIYCGFYGIQSDQQLYKLADEQLTKPLAEQLFASVSAEVPLVLLGTGWDRYAEVLAELPNSQGVAACYPQATAVLQLAQQRYAAGDLGCDPQALAPTYLRDQVADLPKTPASIFS